MSQNCGKCKFFKKEEWSMSYGQCYWIRSFKGKLPASMNYANFTYTSRGRTCKAFVAKDGGK